MRVRVAGNDELSRATVRAMRVTRSLGGYVASVRQSTPNVRDGDAVLILRVPIRNVQRAVLAYAGLGTVVAQHFSVIDLQKRYDAQVERAAKLRAQIAKLEARLETEALTDGDRALVKEQLVYARSELTVLTRQTRTTLNHARLATARLSLTTFRPKKEQEPVAVPSRFDRMLDDTVGVLANEAVWAGYALFLGGPFVLLGLIALAAGRSHRRRAERRLLAA
jgi:cell division protein FtsB